MIVSVFQGILDTLAADATLAGYLGGPYIYRRKAGRPARTPAVTLVENTESSSRRAGYRASPVRDNAPTLQVDVWVSGAGDSFPCTGEDADLIANRIDDVLLAETPPAAGTAGWERTTTSQQYEDDTHLWHNALRYSFRYSVID